MCLKSTFDSTINHLNLSPMFLNCLLLDLTVIDLMSIVHMDKIWVEIAKKLKCGRPEGGGSSVIADTPGRRGEEGANFCGRPLWMAPYQSLHQRFRLLSFDSLRIKHDSENVRRADKK